MTTVAPPFTKMPLTPVSEVEVDPRSSSPKYRPAAASRSIVGNSTNTTSYNGNSLSNWNSYNVNEIVSTDFQTQSAVPYSPSSTAYTSTPKSSISSSPPTPNSAQPRPQLNGTRQRSQSLAIPAPTTQCPRCGLRRLSENASSPVSPGTKMNMNIDTNTRYPFSRPHLPLHLHTTDHCPDECIPPFGVTSPTSASATSPLHKRHHRRRSSLCFAESLVDDADELDNGDVPADVKLGWERQADNIARKVLRRQLAEGTEAVEEAVED